MSWQQWFLVIYFMANALASVAFVGRPREPISSGAAVIMVVLYGGLVAVVVTA